MSILHSLRVALAISSLLAICRAQGSTWIVDIANGSGTHFTNLQVALDAPQVLDGDVLFVRAGNYRSTSAIRTSKGVTIIGLGAPLLDGLSLALRVSNLGAGKRFVLEGVRIAYRWPNYGIHLTNNQGNVHLDDVVIQEASAQDLIPVSAAIHVDTSATATLNRCVVGAGGIVNLGADLLIADSRIEGARARPWLPTQFAARPALELVGGTVWLAQVTAVGGDGHSAAPAQPPAPAVSGRGSVVIAGDSRSSLSAGTTVAPASAIVLQSGSLEIDPRVVLNSHGTAPPIAGGATVTTAPLAFLAGAGAAPTGTIALEVTSATNDAVMLALSLPGTLVPLPFGRAYLHSASLLPLANTVQGPSGRFGLQVPVPGLPELLGLAVVVQAANVQSGTGTLRLTNPVFFVLN